MKTGISTLVALIVALSLPLGASGCAGASEPGKVLIYTSNSGIEQMLQKTREIWEETEDIEISWICPGGSGAVVQKAIQEADRPEADIVIASIPPILSAKDAGVLEKYIPPNAAHVPATFKDADGYFTGWFAFYNCFLYNPDFVPEAPETLEDLLDPAYKGKIMYPDPRTSGDGIRFIANVIDIMGEDAAFQYLKELEKNVIAHPSLVQGSLIDRGETWIAVSDSSINLTEYFNEGLTNQLMFFTEEGTIAAYVGIALIKDAPHPDEARLFLDFLLGEEAQVFVATEGYGIPTREGVELPEELMDAFQVAFEAKVLEVDWTWMVDNMNRWKDRWTADVLGE
ncbi:MAG: extracellular solute-binding protein [Dehalococcoidia bacterium]|nr:extracellular solute-binding protein [Dehalococcoidia bacterium]